MDRNLARRFRYEACDGDPRDPREPDLLATLQAQWETSPSPRVRAVLETMIAHLESEQLKCDRLNKVATAPPDLTEEQRELAKRIADSGVAVQWHEAYRLAQHDIAATSDPAR